MGPLPPINSKKCELKTITRWNFEALKMQHLPFQLGPEKIEYNYKLYSNYNIGSLL